MVGGEPLFLLNIIMVSKEQRVRSMIPYNVGPPGDPWEEACLREKAERRRFAAKVKMALSELGFLDTLQALSQQSKKENENPDRA